jgi:hypothetical protein
MKIIKISQVIKLIHHLRSDRNNMFLATITLRDWSIAKSLSIVSWEHMIESSVLGNTYMISIGPLVCTLRGRGPV